MDGALRDLERAGWDALTDSPEAAQAFYEQVLTDDARMIFPGGVVLDGKAAILDAMGGPPWVEYAIRDLEVRPLTPEVAAVTYAATARRSEGAQLHVRCTSVYVRTSSAWKLALHQHPPN